MNPGSIHIYYIHYHFGHISLYKTSSLLYKCVAFQYNKIFSVTIPPNSLIFSSLPSLLTSHCLRLQDQLLDSYMRTGSFTKENDLPNYSSHHMPRRLYSLVNMLLWAAFVLSQILRFYYNLVVSGSLLSLSFAVGIVICGKFLISFVGHILLLSSLEYFVSLRFLGM